MKKEKKKKERKEVNPNFKHKFTTFHLEARADFEYNYDLNKWGYIDPSGMGHSGSATQHHYGFRGDYFNFLLGGDIGDHISYFFRQRIVPVKGYTELFDNTDFLYIQYKFNDQWSLRMGKEAIYVGGFEYDAPPIDVYYFTHYWGSFPCFLLGVSAGIMVGSAAAAAMSMKKSRKTGLGKTLKTMGQVVDSVAGSFGK